MPKPRITLKKINAALEKRGFPERLVRGVGYFYFVEGNAAAWPTSSVCVSHLEAYTLEEWLAERDELASRA